MAIKTVAILLKIDTGEKEKSSGCLRTDTLPEPENLSIPGVDETYVVTVNDDDDPGLPGKPNKKAMLNTAAHEFGHILSGVFKLPGGMQDDPRTKGEFQGMADWAIEHFSTKDQCQRIWTNEQLAWNIAQKIYPEVDPVEIAESLESYRWTLDKVLKEAA